MIVRCRCVSGMIVMLYRLGFRSALQMARNKRGSVDLGWRTQFSEDNKFYRLAEYQIH